MDIPSTDAASSEAGREAIAAQLNVVSATLSECLSDRWARFEMDFSLDPDSGISLDGKCSDAEGNAIPEEILSFELADEIENLIQLIQESEKDSIVLGGSLLLSRVEGVTLQVRWS